MSDVIEAALQAHTDNGGSSMDALGNSVVMAEAPVEEAPAAPVEASPEAAPAEGAVEPAVPADTPQGAAAAAQDEIDKLLEAVGPAPGEAKDEDAEGETKPWSPI